MSKTATARRTGARVQRVAAAAILLAVIAGFPVLLAAAVGWPLPHTVPTWQQLQDAAGSALPGSVVVKILACGAWLAWAHFTLCVLAEVRTELTGRSLHVPLGGINRQLAHRLVTMALLAGTVAAGTAGLTAAQASVIPAPSASTSSSPVEAVAAPTTTSPTPSADPVQAPEAAGSAAGKLLYVVQAPHHGYYDNLWDIAQRHLGDGMRWREIFALNKDQPQPAGGTLSDPDQVRVGWQLRMPADAHALPSPAPTQADAGQPAVLGQSEVVVEPGDTLSELAVEHGQQSWQDLWQANAGREQPGGARLTDPDLIRPGWRLSIPGVAPAAALPAPAASAVPGGPAAVPPVPVAPPATASAAPGVAAPVPTERPGKGATDPAADRPAVVVPAVPAVPVVPSVPGSPLQQPAPTPAPAPAPAAAAGPGDAAAAGDGSQNWPGKVAFGGSGVLLAAVTAQGLRRLRRRQFRDRALGRTIAASPADVAPMEKALLARGASGAPDVAWLSTALRSLAQTIAADPAGTLPDIVAVSLGADTLELVLTTAGSAAPAPWRADASGLRWSLLRHDELPVDLDADVSAPYPTLATVGQGPDGEHWLLDLERVGALSLAGDRVRCENLARYLAAELAHNTWSDQLLVTLVGFGSELAGLNPARVLHQADLQQATRDARATIAETTQVLAQAHTGVLDGRLRPHLVGDGWSPHVLLVAPGAWPAAGTAGLQSLLADVRAQRARTAVALVLAADTANQDLTRWQLHVDAEGVLTLAELDLRLQAAQLPAEEAADLAALLTLAAQGPDTAMPPSAGDEPWEAFVDAAGALRPDLTRPRAQQTTAGPVRSAGGEPAGDAEQTGTLLPEAVGSYLTSTATTAQDVASLAPVVDPEVRRQVEQADPSLDEDLRLWHDPASGIAKLTVLGPVSISACAGAPSNLRRDRVVEVVAYLACRPQGVSTEQWIAQMWPGEAGVPDSRPRAYANSARQWLGKDPRTGQDYLPRATEGPGKVGSYRLRGVLIDADLFRRLRLRASAREADGLADLQAALALVSGEPLSRLRASGGAWLIDTPVQHHYTAMIVDVAHLVATAHLAAGDPAGAERAAQVSLLTGSRDDVALLDLVAVHDAVGEQALADQYVARILANHDADVEEDLPPRTYEVLRRRQWLPTRDARAS